MQPPRLAPRPPVAAVSVASTLERMPGERQKLIARSIGEALAALLACGAAGAQTTGVIGKDASATFNMPSSTSSALNRVVGSTLKPSEILGKLNSNGNVYIINRLARDVPLIETFKGVVPFLLSDLLRTLLLLFFPVLSLALVHVFH